jgi:para-nitrobenzyl esterase
MGQIAKARIGVGARSLIGLVGCLLATAAMAGIGTVVVSGGKLEGIVADGVLSFKGIPFAAPPVGNLRWKPPQPVEPWSGIRKADGYGPACMQPAGELPAATRTSEDCLDLNVWTAASSADEKRPVMVWLHGGGFYANSPINPATDGTNLARKGVVLVSVAYRLGPFGFLAHPLLTAEGGGHSGNYGLRDMIAALEWVHANIAAFGGDPGRVTIFGQSAGAVAVSTLAVSPRAAGLFQRVIAQSGTNFTGPESGNGGGLLSFRAPDAAEKTGQVFLEGLGVHDLAAARALPADVVLAAAAKTTRGGPGIQFWPVFDGDLLPGNPYDLYESGKFNDTPVLIGSNSLESELFRGSRIAAGVAGRKDFEARVRATYGASAEAILAAYPHTTDAEAHQSADELFRDGTFGWPTLAWAVLQSQSGRGRAYVYYFDHRTAQSPRGARHGSEIFYIFQNLGGTHLAGPGVPAPTPENEKLADVMSSYWVNFAAFGDPNGARLPHWPAFTPKAQQVLYIDGHIGAGPLPNMHALRGLESINAPRLMSSGSTQ